MRFGVCTGPDNAAKAKAAGWDYIEGNVQNLFKGEQSGYDAGVIKGSAAPILAANCLVPGHLKITGPQADLNVLRDYMSNVLKRAGETGVKTLVFGSGGARQVPDGFDRQEARRQILDFLQMSADIAARHEVTIVIEPLNRKECNIINSVEEGMTYVRELNHDYLLCLVDSYHFWLENEPLKNLEKAMRWIGHVHVADKVNRTAPGESGAPAESPYTTFFRVLKAGKYKGTISIECKAFDIANDSPRILKFLKEAWEKA
jgi:D-psicose/D-tagatose/L-ribulose 3-epimerase